MKFLLILLVGSPLYAASVTEDFSTSAHLDAGASTGIWNLSTQRLHLPRKVDRDQTDATPSEDDDLFLGTGKDGAFAPTSDVTLDSSVVHEFTSFTIPAGVTVTCTGSAPLDIRVQGDVAVLGVLDVSGSGVTGGCGSVSTGDGNNGSVTNGGGGGGYFNSGENGNGGTVGGSSYGNEWVVPLQGGSKGGNSGTGVLGGGGGGAVRISAGGSVRVDGQILAFGANGAGVGGGGGSGGAIVLFASGTLDIDGQLGATGGADPGPFGNGSEGFIRWTSDTPAFTPSGTVSPSPAQLLFGLPVYASTQNYVITTTAYDTGVHRPDYTSFETLETLNGGTVTYELAGSSDNFVSDDTGFLAPTELRSLRGKRYFKVRITLRSTNPATSPEVTRFALNFDAFLPSFDFRASCSAVHGPATPASVMGSLAFLLYLCAIPFLARRLAKRTPL